MATDRVTVASPDMAAVERIAGVLRAAGFEVEPVAPGTEDLPGIVAHSRAEWILLDRRVGAGPGPVSVPPFTPATLEEVERRYLAAMLDHAGGNKRQAALLLGIARSTLQQKVRRYGLDQGAPE